MRFITDEEMQERKLRRITTGVSEAIRTEATECAKSAEDHRNTPENRNIFHVVSIILIGIADKLDGKTTL